MKQDEVKTAGRLLENEEISGLHAFSFPAPLRKLAALASAGLFLSGCAAQTPKDPAITHLPISETTVAYRRLAAHYVDPLHVLPEIALRGYLRSDEKRCHERTARIGGGSVQVREFLLAKDSAYCPRSLVPDGPTVKVRVYGPGLPHIRILGEGHDPLIEIRGQFKLEYDPDSGRDEVIFVAEEFAR